MCMNEGDKNDKEEDEKETKWDMEDLKTVLFCSPTYVQKCTKFITCNKTITFTLSISCLILVNMFLYI